MKRTGFDTMSPFAYPFYICKHPRDGFLELRANKKGSALVVSIIVAVWLFVELFYRVVTDFDMNPFTSAPVSLLRTGLVTVIIFFMVAISNWCFCTLLDGKGKLLDICVVLSCALVPYIFARFATTLLSLVLAGDEKVFLNYFVIITEIWGVIIAFSGLEEMHEYSMPKTVLAIFLTFVGLTIMLFIALMLLSLFQQLYFFILTVFYQIKY